MFDSLRGSDGAGSESSWGSVAAAEPEPVAATASSRALRVKIASTAFYAPPLIQHELGLEGIPSFSIHASCMSFLVALGNAAALVAAGTYRRVLVVSAEVGSCGRNMSEPESAALIGDGAAAAVLEPTPKGEASELAGWRMRTWPKGAALTEVRGYGQRCSPLDPLSVAGAVLRW